MSQPKEELPMEKMLNEAEETKSGTVLIIDEEEETAPARSAGGASASLLPTSPNLTPDGLAGHRLTSTSRGESSIEKIAQKIDERRNNRIPVTAAIRLKFLHSCRDIARSQGIRNKISVRDLHTLRDACKARVDAQHADGSGGASMMRSFMVQLGFWDEDYVLLKLYDRAVEMTSEVEADWFHFRDFSFYQTRVTATRPAFESDTFSAIKWLFLFYLFTAVLFCAIMDEDTICPSDDERPYLGWLSAIYFASVTMSTVGYGDLSLDPDTTDDRWRVFIATMYMILSIWVGYTVFAVAADAALSGLSVCSLGDKITEMYDNMAHASGNLNLDARIRRIRVIRFTELILLGILYNLIGIFAARIFIYYSDPADETEEKELDWTWMTTLYWAVQTTTTIGYGDLTMPVDMRWFQIFYTTLGTVLVGSVFGGIASLSQELQDLKRFYAWERREVSKRLLEDMQGENSDGKIDQYEFLVGSLLVLNKLERSDIDQIMDKFRQLAGDKGYIDYVEETADEIGMENVTSTREGNEAEDLTMDIDDVKQTFR